MKQFLFLLSVLSVVASKVVAQDPIAMDGKEWHIRAGHYIYFSDIHMWIDGDTIVDGMVCKKLYKHTKQLWEDGEERLEVGYCRQDGEKYYQNGELMFDFSLQKGDKFSLRGGYGTYSVIDTGHIVLKDGVSRRCLTVMDDMESFPDEYNSDVWVEGIGSLSMGVYSNDFVSDGQVKTLQSCCYGEKIIYSREILPFVDKCRGFMLYESNECSYYTLYGECTIDGVDYIKEGEGRYAYRQDGDKVYCYSFAEGKESLVMDFGLEVGDIFTLYEGFDVVVEQKSDTLLAFWNAKMTCKRLLLRGVEQPDFTDTWIEGIGSLRYGINPPKAEDTYLLHSSLYMEECKDYCDYCTFIFDPQKDDLYATMVTLGEEIYEDAFSDHNEYMEAFYEDKLLTLDLRNDTLHIGGYIGTYCEQSLYLLIEEGVDTIYIMSIPFPLDPEADCLSINRIDANFPGFTQDSYTVNFWGRIYQISRSETSLTIVEQKNEDVPSYDLQGRPVANPTRGIYIKDGRKVVIGQ